MTTTPEQPTAPATDTAATASPTSFLELLRQWRMIVLVLAGAGVGGFSNNAVSADKMTSTLEQIKIDIAVLKTDVGALKNQVEKCRP